MEVSIYRFSDRLKDYGTDKFYIPSCYKRYKKKPKENQLNLLS